MKLILRLILAFIIITPLAMLIESGVHKVCDFIWENSGIKPVANKFADKIFPEAETEELSEEEKARAAEEEAREAKKAEIQAKRNQIMEKLYGADRVSDSDKRMALMEEHSKLSDEWEEFEEPEEPTWDIGYRTSKGNYVIALFIITVGICLFCRNPWVLIIGFIVNLLVYTAL